MNVRVAYFVNQYPKVSHTFIRREIAALERQGVTVDRIALRGWDAEVKDAQDVAERERTQYVLRGSLAGLAAAGLWRLVRHPARAWAALGLAWRMARRAERSLPWHLVYLLEACRVATWLERSGAQHVHAHFGTNSTEVVMLAHALGGPGYSFTAHGPEEFDKPEFLGMARKIAHASFVVAISSFGRSQLCRWVPAAQWPKIRVVHCGLEPDFFAAAGQIRPAPVPRLVCVGRLCEQKGQLLLVAATAILARRGVAIELVLAGDGEMRADIEAAIAAANLQAHVRITGWIGSEQVRDELLAARALVLPSFAEGLPVVIMEAMAIGRPVISTYVAGIPELVRDGVDGWLVPAGDVEALADAMHACLDTPPDRLEAMGRSAHERVQARHAIDVEAGRLRTMFETAIAENAA
jgi:colanic acid/amylovoran biosynthesis glycosyltransferase